MFNTPPTNTSHPAVNRLTTKSLVLSSFFVAIISLVAVILLGTRSQALPYGSGGYNDCAYGGACSISIATSGTINIALQPTVSSVYSIQKDSVIVNTNSPLGYTLSLQSNSPSNTSLVNGAYSLTASTGTPSSPVVLQANTWGYRLDGQASFGAGPTSATTNASSSTLTFAGLTLSGSPRLIYSKSSESGVGGDTVNVWYGTRANTSVPAGTYSQTVVYTATTLP